MKNIKTNFIYPPIPIRDMDWSAWYDGEEESGRVGFGKTESEAVAQLKKMYPEDDSDD